MKPSLELLRNAGIRIWMLTGDKLETAICIAQSSRLVPRTQSIHVFGTVSSRTDTHQELNSFRRKTDCALVIRGESLELCLSVRNNFRIFYSTFQQMILKILFNSFTNMNSWNWRALPRPLFAAGAPLPKKLLSSVLSSSIRVNVLLQ